MPKNPFVNCKSRKRRKTRVPIPKPKEKLFCPPTMVRYDNTATEYKTVWTCKMCLMCLLSEDAVRAHVIICNTKTKKKESQPQPIKEEITNYVCDTCNKVFSRSVTLKRHLEVHQQPASDFESELSDDDRKMAKKRKIKVEANSVKQEYDDESD